MNIKRNYGKKIWRKHLEEFEKKKLYVLLEELLPVMFEVSPERIQEGLPGEIKGRF